MGRWHARKVTYMLLLAALAMLTASTAGRPHQASRQRSKKIPRDSNIVPYGINEPSEQQQQQLQHNQQQLQLQQQQAQQEQPDEEGFLKENLTHIKQLQQQRHPKREQQQQQRHNGGSVWDFQLPATLDPEFTSESFAVSRVQHVAQRQQQQQHSRGQQQPLDSDAEVLASGNQLPGAVMSHIPSQGIRRQLLQAPWKSPPAPQTYAPLVNNNTVTAYSKFDSRSPDNIGHYDVDWGADHDIAGVQVRADAQNPIPKDDNPDGWRFKTVANSSLVFTYPSGHTADKVSLRNYAVADSKLAPAIALAGTSGELKRMINAETAAEATSRPGLQYGATVAIADQHQVSTQDYAYDYGGVYMSTRARAQAGQGQTVAIAKGRGEVKQGTSYSDVRSDANSARWYMSPGHAISGAVNIGRGGRAKAYTENRARSSIGTAMGGVLIHNIGSGDFGGGFYSKQSGGLAASRGDYSAANSMLDQKVDNGVGSAAGGYVQLGRSFEEDVQITNKPGAVVATAVGNAVAGGISVAVADNGGAYIGDYDDEIDTPDNDVAATSRGRGSAQAGQINIALAPNRDSSASGDIKATAVQGAVTGGAFTVTNSALEAYHDITVDARTAEGNAVAGNVGVAQAGQKAETSNSANAATTTGSALAFTISNSALAQQSQSSSAGDATTTTGQAAGIGASQSVGGIFAQSQGASSATTSEGNALSVGSAFSGSTMVSRAVSTAAAATHEGQAVSSAWGGALAADSQVGAASSAQTVTGNAGSIGQGYGLGVLQGKSIIAASSGTEQGSAGSLGFGVSTGLIQAQSKVASSAQTQDGRAQSIAGAVSVSGINSVSTADANAASETGDVTANAFAIGIGVLHGEAESTASASTGCSDCISDAVANALATGLVADASARATADSDTNPGNSLANTVAVGFISRTSNGGSSRVAVGPGQALSGGFAISAPKHVADESAAAAGDTAPANSAAADVDSIAADTPADSAPSSSSSSSSSSSGEGDAAAAVSDSVGNNDNSAGASNTDPFNPDVGDTSESRFAMLEPAPNERLSAGSSSSSRGTTSGSAGGSSSSSSLLRDKQAYHTIMMPPDVQQGTAAAATTAAARDAVRQGIMSLKSGRRAAVKTFRNVHKAQ